ncbi:unnamed protein product, partial [Prorocentrum cordatum]
GKQLLGAWGAKLRATIQDLDFQDGNASKTSLQGMAVLAASTGTFEDGAFEALDTEVSRRQKLDAVDQMARWEAWAKKAVAGGGKAAHAFSKKQVSCHSGRAATAKIFQRLD